MLVSDGSCGSQMSHSKGGPDDALKLLSEFCTLPRRSGFRTTTGVHLHTGFKAWLRCDPSVVRGLWRRTEERTFAKKRALLPTNMQLKLQVFAAIFCFPFTRVCDNFIKPAIYPSREKGGRTWERSARPACFKAAYCCSQIHFYSPCGLWAGWQGRSAASEAKNDAGRWMLWM